MRKSYLLLLLCSLMAFHVSGQTPAKENKGLLGPVHGSARSSSVFLYSLTTLSEPYEDLTGAVSINNGELWDDPTYSIPIGFAFELNGNTITSLEFQGVGALLAATTADPDVATAVFPFEMDMIDRGDLGGESQSPLSYKLEGSPGSRILKVEWNNAGSFSEWLDGTQNMYINLQLWLYEGSNKIEFRFGDNLVDNPALFYGGEGIFMGVTDINDPGGFFINPHFFTGDIGQPELSASDVTIEGTPSSGTVYRLTLSVPLEVDVTGINGNSTCDPNGSATAVATGGVEPYTYLWSNDETTPTITFIDAGTYTVTVTDASGETVTGSVTITNASPINPNASATDETFVNGNDGTATSSAFGGTAPYSFLWNTGETTQSITGLAPGIYTVVVTDDVGCTAGQSVIVSAFGCPDIEFDILTSDASCFGGCDGEINIDVLGGTSPYTYIWSNGSSSEDLTGLCAGEYFLTIVDANGCTGEGGPYIIAEPPQMLANAGSTDETGPDANDGTAWAAPTGGTPPYTYLWSNNSTDSLITNLVPGFYSVTVRDAHMCAVIASVEIDSFGCSLTGFVLNNSCFQSCDGSIEVTPVNGTGPFTYQWSNGVTSAAINGLCAGVFGVTVVDATGCVATGSFSVEEPAELLANAGSTDESAPGANDGSAWATPTGGTAPYTYEWSNGSTDSLITNLFPWVYTVIITDAHACTDTQSVIINTYPCMGVLVWNTFDLTCYESCDGEAGVGIIGGVGPITFEWNTGDTTSSITNLCAGTYDVTITDEGQSCVRTQSFEIVQPDSIAIVVDQVINYNNLTAGIITITVTGGTPTYQFNWTGPNGYTSTEEDLSGLSPGLYTLIVTDGNGCVVSNAPVEILDETVGTKTLTTLDVSVFPNPAKDEVYIAIEDITGFSVRMRSFDGRLMKTWSEEKSLDVSSLPAGVYLLEGISDSKIFRTRVVIAR